MTIGLLLGPASASVRKLQEEIGGLQSELDQSKQDKQGQTLTRSSAARGCSPLSQSHNPGVANSTRCRSGSRESRLIGMSSTSSAVSAMWVDLGLPLEMIVVAVAIPLLLLVWPL
jgi:hypothetical protein